MRLGDSVIDQCVRISHGGGRSVAIGDGEMLETAPVGTYRVGDNAGGVHAVLETAPVGYLQCRGVAILAGDGAGRVLRPTGYGRSATAASSLSSLSCGGLR